MAHHLVTDVFNSKDVAYLKVSKTNQFDKDKSAPACTRAALQTRQGLGTAAQVGLVKIALSPFHFVVFFG